MQHFKYVVVGKGMMGSAAAKYLAEQADGVALIGPDEPHDKKAHAGVFASHYDEGRITRTIDPDPNWATLANRSVARYRDIEARSGVPFYSEVGCLLTGPRRGENDGYIGRVIQSAEALKVETDILDDTKLADTFSFFAFPSRTEGVFEPKGAGHISPRRLVAAQGVLAAKAGAAIKSAEVVRLVAENGRVSVHLGNGETVSADKLLVATGGFTNGSGLLPKPIELLVCARTVAYFEVSEAEAARLAAMPSLITKPADDSKSIYLLPPIRYPDGKFYLKTGGEPFDIPISNDKDMRAWFRTDGMPSVRVHMIERTREVVPSLNVINVTSAACVTSYTPSSYPMIGFSSNPNIAVLAGCGGASAKSSDEIGRLGSELIMHGAVTDAAYTTSFPADFRGR